MQLYIALFYFKLPVRMDRSSDMCSFLSGRILGFCRIKEAYREGISFGKCCGMSGVCGYCLDMIKLNYYYSYLIESSKSPASIAQSNKQWAGLAVSGEIAVFVMDKCGNFFA